MSQAFFYFSKLFELFSNIIVAFPKHLWYYKVIEER